MEKAPYSDISAQPQPPPPPSYNQTMYNAPSAGVQTAPPPVQVPLIQPGMVTATTTTTGAPFVAGTNTVVIMPQTVIFGKFPVNVVCQHCHATVLTEPRPEVGLVTWAISGALILLGFWLGCCLIPFCIDDCKDIYHDCPNCHKVIHVFKRF